MVLKTIQASAKQYAQWLASQRFHPNAHQWEAQQNFQSNWDDTATDMAKMYDAALQNSKTQRTWQADRWEPKRVMELLIAYNPESAKLMFQDFFDETKDIENRIGRFLFFCDDLLSDYKSDNQTSIENNHYHGDYRMLSLYLAYRYPDTYAPYNFEHFRSAMDYFQAKTVPQVNDVGRYFKVANTLYTFLEKDGNVLPNLNKLLDPRKHYTQKSFLVVADFLWFTRSISPERFRG